MLEGFLIRRQHDTEALQVGHLALVDLAVEQRQLVLKAVVVATDVTQGPRDISDRRTAGLAEGQRLIGAVRIGIDQQLQATLDIILAVELGDALEAHLRIQRLDLAISAQQTLPAVLIVVEQWQQVVHGVVDRVHERRTERQVRRKQLTTA